MESEPAIRPVSAAISRALTWRPALSWAILGLSMTAHGLAAAVFFAARRDGLVRNPVVLGFLLPLVVLAVLSVSGFVARRAWSFRALQLARVAVLLGGITAFGVPWGTDTLLLLAIAADIVVHERRSLGLPLSCGLVILVAVLKVVGERPPGLGIADASLTLVAGLAAAVLGSVAIRHREARIELEATAERLEAAVSMLSEANLGYQQQATDSERTSMIEERQRITREIHDIIGHTLTNTIMMMEAATDMASRNPDGVVPLLQTARRAAQEGFDQIRDSLHLLRAQEEPYLPPLRCLVRTVDLFRVATGLEVKLDLANVTHDLDDRIGYAVYTVVREALTNAHRHGRATEVRITLWKEEDRLLVSVWDNGCGAAEVTEGIGLAGMRERLEPLGGELTVDTEGPGFRVRAQIPLPG